MKEPWRDWFEVAEMRPGLWMICEPGHVASWLLIGDERACLFDTGMGLVPIRPVVESITTLPVIVVNTHYHFDHVGGNDEFEIVLAHPGAAKSPRATNEFVVNRYTEFAVARQARGDQYRELDGEFFGLITPDTDPKILMPDFSQRMASSMHVDRTPTSDLVEGLEIDLGGRRITALHTPGHSPDSMCFLDDKDGILIAGDTFNIGTVYCHFADSDVDQLAESAARLSELAPEVGYIIAHHYPRLIGETSLLHRFHRAVRSLRTQPFDTTVDVLGQECRYATSDLFTLTIPAEGVDALV